MIRVISNNGEPIQEPVLKWTEVTDPTEIAEARAAKEAFARNADWLQGHWPELLPATGKRSTPRWDRRLACPARRHACPTGYV